MNKDSTKGKRPSKKPTRPATATKKKPISQSLRARALAIINNEGYDHDTRESIRYMLKTKVEDLATWVSDAEKGVTICDTFMSLAHQREGVRQVVKILNSGRGVIPLWFLEAVNNALVTVANTKGIDPAFVNFGRHGTWEGVSPNASKLITKLFESTGLGLDRDFMFAPVRTDSERVIDATAEILRNPQTPDDLFEHVAEYVTTVFNTTNGGEQIIYTAPILSVLIGSCPVDERMGAVHARHAAEDAKREQEVQS